MKKYFFKISYNGTDFSGWQRQKEAVSVQELIENALSNIYKKRVIIVGCGRTDAGVHADNYYFHAFLAELKPQLKFKLNKLLPSTIAVKNIFEVDEKAHAQKNATLRVYTYYLHFEKDPLLANFSSWYPYGELNFSEMKKAAALVQKTRDFQNFCLSPHKHKSTVCHLTAVEVHLHPNKKQMAIRFSGDHFLRSMIRILVGELLQIGLGKTMLSDFEKYLNLQLKKPKHHKAYPQGLHLTNVLYPFVKNENIERVWQF